jgi:hypothetical protein
MTDVPPDVPAPHTQGETGLPPDKPEGQWLSLSGQMISPQVVQDEQEKNLFLHGEPRASGVHVLRGEHPPPALTPRYSRPVAKRLLETSAPAALPVTEALRCWAAEAVPALPLDRERDKFLCYARAHGVTNIDWAEALKGWWLEAYDRAVRRGDLQPQATPRAEPVPGLESPPEDRIPIEEVRQLTARFLGIHTLINTNNGQGVDQRHAPSILTAEGTALERDPAYLAQVRARRAILQAQAARLRAQELCLEAVGAAN